MRYLTNNLGWRNDPFVWNGWIGQDDADLESHFCFGGRHVWQAPVGQDRLFGTESLVLRQAQSWIKREPFESLVSGPSAWGVLMSEMLGVEVSNCVPLAKDESGIRLSSLDVVLRLGIAGGVPSGSSEADLISLLRREPDLATWHLHFIRAYHRPSFVAWDAGL